jgi:tetratricopeptide (TPR) repeat protein
VLNFGISVSTSINTSVLTLPASAAEGWQETMDEALSLYQKNDLTMAERGFSDAFRIAEGFGDRDPRYGISLYRLGATEERLNQLQEAETHLKQAQAALLLSKGPASIEKIRCDNRLAIIYIRKGQYSDAEYLLRKCIVITSGQTPSTMLGQDIVGNVRYIQNLLANPDQIPGSIDSANVLYTYGRMLEAQGNTDFAAKLYKRVLDMFNTPSNLDATRMFGDPFEGRPDLNAIRQDLAKIYQKQGNSTEADKLLKQIQE